MKKQITRAIILAAGTGRRLRPLTNETPKCLLLVGGLPILHHQLSALKKNGITEITIAVGFMADGVRKYAESNFPGLHFDFVHNPIFGSTNTLYSLALVADTVKKNGSILLMNGDVVFDPEIIGMLEGTHADKSFVAMVPGQCAEEEIKISLTSDGSIANLNKQVEPAHALGEAVGINKFSETFWTALARNLEALRDTFPSDYFERAIEETVRHGHKIYPSDIGGRFALEIDFREDLEKADRIIRNNSHYV